VKFIDDFRLGDQSEAPTVLKEDKGKNHYFFLPLLLGLIGLFFQLARDKRACWLNFLLFFMTGIAIVLYINQTPYQVRERDYSYAGSFYFFCVWIGLGVAGLWSLFEKRLSSPSVRTAVSCALCLLCFGVPTLMASENWDDHDRSNRRTAVEMGRNYLDSAGKDGILIAHGDNDTFPLWYAQEVENFRTDVRICNTSLLGTDWHIDQMKWAVNESSPLPLTVGLEQYLYGTNEYIPIYDTRSQVMSLSDVMKIFKHPQIKASMTSGRKVDYIASRKISMPVNKENVLRAGIVDAKFADQIPDSIVLTIPEGKDFITKQELFMLDLLDGYDWSRQINTLAMGGDLNIGIKEYLQFDGFSYRFIPIKNKTTTTVAGFVDTDDLYRKMTSVYKWRDLSADDYFIDYQNDYVFLGSLSIRNMFVTASNAFLREGERDRALEMVDMCAEVMKNYPKEAIPLGLSGNDYMVVNMVDNYYKLGQTDKARALAAEMGEELLKSAKFYFDFYDWAKSDFELVGNYIYFLADVETQAGDKETADSLTGAFLSLINASAEAEPAS